MVIATSSAYLSVAIQQATTKPAQTTSKAPATAGPDVPYISEEQVGELVRAKIATAVARAQVGRAQAAPPALPTQPTPPASPFQPGRTFTIQGPNGERTVIGMPSSKDMIPPEAVDISIAFFLMLAAIIIGLPIARAFARRMDRKSGGTAQIPSEVTAQLAHLNQAVDAIAVEVERISEGQRFTTRLLSEQRDAAQQTLPSGSIR